MSLFFKIRLKVVKPLFILKDRLVQFNMAANAVHHIKKAIRSNNIPNLTNDEKRYAKSFFKSKGYKLKNTYWHQYYKGMNGQFYKEYIPEDIFRSLISPKLNQMIQWPALLDKNLYYNLFREFNQPKLILSNANGFFYLDGKLVNEKKALMACANYKGKMIIKPSIDSGAGFMVKSLSIDDISPKDKILGLKQLLKPYKKDFVIQAFVNQSSFMKQLNLSSLNTFRIMSYLSGKNVHILSTVLRVGKKNSITDNYTIGGVICGVNENGILNDLGYDKKGNIYTQTDSGFVFKDSAIPNFEKIKAMVRSLHKRVPYFRIISWDIGLDSRDNPIFIEYNTYHQATELHQVTNGPLFGSFSDEIFKIGVS